MFHSPPPTRGSGHRNDPFRYWNASLDQKWANDPVLGLLAGQEEARRELGRGGGSEPCLVT